MDFFEWLPPGNVKLLENVTKGKVPLITNLLFLFIIGQSLKI